MDDESSRRHHRSHKTDGSSNYASKSSEHKRKHHRDRDRDRDRDSDHDTRDDERHHKSTKSRHKDRRTAYDEHDSRGHKHQRTTTSRDRSHERHGSSYQHRTSGSRQTQRHTSGGSGEWRSNRHEPRSRSQSKTPPPPQLPLSLPPPQPPPLSLSSSTSSRKLSSSRRHQHSKTTHRTRSPIDPHTLSSGNYYSTAAAAFTDELNLSPPPPPKIHDTILSTGTGAAITMVRTRAGSISDDIEKYKNQDYPFAAVISDNRHDAATAAAVYDRRCTLDDEDDSYNDGIIIDKEKIHSEMQERLRRHLAAQGKVYPPPKPERQETMFANDGSFLEMFKRMQEEQQHQQQHQQQHHHQQSGGGGNNQAHVIAAKTETVVKRPPQAVVPMVGKRRGGKILKTGIVEKQKIVNGDGTGEDMPKDIWSVYLQEVKKYKSSACDVDNQTRPLVK